MLVTLIDYGSGNLRSAAKAFERMGERTGHRVLVSGNPSDVEAAAHIVLPGVGAFADCMAGLTALPGMIAALRREVLECKKPFLGICVGMQLLAEKGFEHGEHSGLGWIPGEVRALSPSGKTLKIPHMGWNELDIKRPHKLFAGIGNGDHAYFVHSYHFVCADAGDVLAETDYGGPVTASVARGNIMGTQFHPEKSQETGLRLIENFLMSR